MTRPLPWFRTYVTDRNDARLRALPDPVFRVWFNLTCLAAEQTERRGCIQGYDDLLLAVEVAGGNVDLLHATLEQLQQLRLVTIDDGAILHVDFDARQYDRPSDRPERVKERVRKHRAETRHADVASCNAAETTRNAQDRDQDQDPELDPESAPDQETAPDPQHQAAPSVETAERARATGAASTPYALFSALCAETGANPADAAPGFKRQQLGIAKHLVADGYDEAAVRGCVRYLQSQDWRTGLIDLRTVQSEIGRWTLAGRPPTAKKAGTDQTTAPPADRSRPFDPYGSWGSLKEVE